MGRYVASTEVNCLCAGSLFAWTVLIRPLAKLSKAVKVADAGNQGKAESKTFSAVTVTLREDTKSFDETDGVFN